MKIASNINDLSTVFCNIWVVTSWLQLVTKSLRARAKEIFKKYILGI